MASSPVDANRANLLDAFKSLYWKAAQREICTMILFFGDVLDQAGAIEHFLNLDTTVLKCENFTRMFDLWRRLILMHLSLQITWLTPIVGGQRQGWQGFDTQPLYKQTMTRVRGEHVLRCHTKIASH